jgi:hypothetical protein
VPQPISHHRERARSRSTLQESKIENKKGGYEAEQYAPTKDASCANALSDLFHAGSAIFLKDGWYPGLRRSVGRRL